MPAQEKRPEDHPKNYLVADLFCGAGGFSSGARKAIEEAGGTMTLVAVNHWPTAIATHAANHPATRHIVEDVSLADPEAAVEEGYLNLLMASPECRYHSRARGGKPIHNQNRMNPWAIMNWLTRLDVQRVLVENVPEFVHWGPLGPDNRPLKSRRGEYFQAWFLAFGSLGYRAEWRMLNAANYGDATARTRFFLLARNDGHPIVWPEPTHAKPGGRSMLPGLLPWRGAKEIIDWSNPGRSLLDDRQYLRRPLAEKTRRRIARGLEKFGGPMAPLYIRLLDIPGPEVPELKAPELKVEGTETGATFILNRHGENGGNRCHPVDEPVPSLTTRGAGYRVDAQARQVETPARPGNGARPFTCANRANCVPRGLEEPMHAATNAGSGGLFVISPETRPLSPEGAEGAARPAGTTIIHYYGESCAQGVEQPLTTITQCNKHALVQAVIIHPGTEEQPEQRGTDPAIPDPKAAEAAARELERRGADPRRLVFINGQPHLLDIRFRMLQNPELARAMGFDEEDHRYEFAGNAGEVTRQIGNAVPVNLATALVRAALTDPPEKEDCRPLQPAGPEQEKPRSTQA